MSNIIQVTNIASTVTEDNIKTLFSFVGQLREIIIFYEDAQQDETKVAYIVFESNNDAETALHLHNTLFHDRALIILPLADSCKGQIPDLSYAKMVRAPDKTVTGICAKTKNWPSDVINMVVGRTGEQSIITIEPSFVKQGLPNYPKLPYSTEVAKIDEIRRTILITNLDTGTSPQQVLDFFQPVAEVKFIRMAGSEHDNAAYVEFSEQGSVAKAFGMMGTDLNDRAVMIQHSNVAINKPSSNHRGNEDISRKTRDSVSRSRSRHKRSHRRSRSRHSRSIKGSRTHRSRSRRGSKSRRKSQSRTRRRSRSRRGSKSRRRSPSRSRRARSKTRSPRKSRSRPRKDRKKSISKPKERKKSISKHRERKTSVPRSKDYKKKSVERKDRSRSRHRRPKDSRSRHESQERTSKKRERNGSCDKSRKFINDKLDESRRKPSSESNRSNLLEKTADIEKNGNHIIEVKNKNVTITKEEIFVSKDCENSTYINHATADNIQCDSGQ